VIRGSTTVTDLSVATYDWITIGGCLPTISDEWVPCEAGFQDAAKPNVAKFNEPSGVAINTKDGKVYVYVAECAPLKLFLAKRPGSLYLTLGAFNAAPETM